MYEDTYSNLCSIRDRIGQEVNIYGEARNETQQQYLLTLYQCGNEQMDQFFQSGITGRNLVRQTAVRVEALATGMETYLPNLFNRLREHLTLRADERGWLSEGKVQSIVGGKPIDGWRSYAEEPTTPDGDRDLLARELLKQTPGSEQSGGAIPVQNSQPHPLASGKGNLPAMPQNLKRPKDLKTSEQRLKMLAEVKKELKIVSQIKKSYVTIARLKRMHPKLLLWKLLDKEEQARLVDEDFRPIHYANLLVARKHGISPRTLKYDREKLRRSEASVPD